MNITGRVSTGAVKGAVNSPANASGTTRGMGVGTLDYNALDNKPQIEGVTLRGNKSFGDLGLVALTNMEINDLLED